MLRAVLQGDGVVRRVHDDDVRIGDRVEHATLGRFALDLPDAALHVGVALALPMFVAHLLLRHAQALRVLVALPDEVDCREECEHRDDRPERLAHESWARRAVVAASAPIRAKTSGSAGVISHHRIATTTPIRASALVSS